MISVPAIMPVPGNRAATALARARELLRQSGLARGDILLITDESEGEAAVNAAAALRADGYRVSVLGVGTEQGAPVPLPFAEKLPRFGNSFPQVFDCIHRSPNTGFYG